MSAKDILQDARNIARSDLTILEEEYYSMPPGERECTEWGWSLAEQIENLREAIDYLDKADELMED